MAQVNLGDYQAYLASTIDSTAPDCPGTVRPIAHLLAHPPTVAMHWIVQYGPSRSPKAKGRATPHQAKTIRRMAAYLQKKKGPCSFDEIVDKLKIAKSQTHRDLLADLVVQGIVTTTRVGHGYHFTYNEKRGKVPAQEKGEDEDE